MTNFRQEMTYLFGGSFQRITSRGKPLEPPTQPMRAEAASADFYQSPGWHTSHPRLQLLTIEELLSGKTIDMPPIRHTNVTFKKAPRAKGEQADQGVLPFGKDTSNSADETNENSPPA